MSEIFNNIHIWVFLVNSESVLRIAFVKYMLFSDCTENCTFLFYFLEASNLCFVTKNYSKFSYICVLTLSQQRNWFLKSFHNSETVGRRKLTVPLLNRIFNALSIGVQYTFLFQWINIGLKCLLLEKCSKINDNQKIYFHTDIAASTDRIFTLRLLIQVWFVSWLEKGCWS